MDRRAVTTAKALLLASVVLSPIVIQACTTREVIAVDIGTITLHPGTASLLDGQSLQFTATVTDASGVLLPNVTVTWETDDPEIVSIDAQGVLEALGAGSATVRAVFRGVDGTASVAVFPGPTLTLSEDSVSFQAGVGAPPPPTDVEVTVVGLGSIGGLEASVEYGQGEPQGWLAATLAATTAPTTLTLTPATAPLTVGAYHATVLLDSDTGDDPVSLPVSLTVSGLSVLETGGATSVGEDGRRDTLFVALVAEPASDVVVEVTSADETEVTVNPERFTFTPSSWSTPRVVVLRAPDDPLVDGNTTTLVTVAVVDPLSDPTLASVPEHTISVTTLDDEHAGFTIEETRGRTTVTNGGKDEVRVRLDAQPLGNVVIVIRSEDPTSLAVDPVELTFTPENWSKRQNVELTSVSDGGFDGLRLIDVIFSIDDERSHDAFDDVPDQVVGVLTYG